MATQTTGNVTGVLIARSMAKVYLRSYLPKIPIPLDHIFLIYNDGSGGVTIDPTEMVKRNWLIALLLDSLRNKLKVTISHTDDLDAVVRAVHLYAAE